MTDDNEPTYEQQRLPGVDWDKYLPPEDPPGMPTDDEITATLPSIAYYERFAVVLWEIRKVSVLPTDLQAAEFLARKAHYLDKLVSDG